VNCKSFIYKKVSKDVKHRAGSIAAVNNKLIEFNPKELWWNGTKEKT